MSKCVDCGSELDDGERYCQVCGSPTNVTAPTDQELRDFSTQTSDSTNLQRRTKRILIAILLLIMTIFAFFLSKLVAQMGSTSGRLY